MTSGVVSSTLSVVSSTPADSAVLVSSPTSLAVRFDRTIDDFSLDDQDFDLLHVADDGSTNPLAPGEAVLVESLDPSGSQVDLVLSKPLVQGRYELRIDPESQLAGIDGSLLAGGGSAAIVANFTVGTAASATVATTDVGALGPRVTAVPGNLNLAADPGAVQSYQFELAPGHHYLVGLAISAHDVGGTLDSSISLFDAQHRLIATAKEGLASDPGDPYLFQGLQAGTYYVGVAARQDLPNASGAYHTADTTIDAADPGGPFRLQLVATPADQPTRLLGLRLDHADPLSASPTGLTLQFSGPLDLVAMEQSGRPALTLVDANGATWSLSPTHYDATTGQLSLAFDRPLVAGTYTLERAGSGGLVDLAGLAPVAPGLPAGTLGSFVVGPSLSVDGDLGAILPDLAASGLQASVTVEPGQATTAQFVVIEPGVYALKGIEPAGGVRFSIVEESGKVLTSGPGASSKGETFLDLAAGVYRVVLTTDSPASKVAFTIVEKQAQFSSLLESGIGQASALGLRLVTPQADFGAASGTPTTATSTSTSTASPTPAAPSSTGPGSTSNLADRATPASPSPSADARPNLSFGVSVPSGPSVAGLSFGAGPVGRPLLEQDHLGVVGPSGGSTGSTGSTGLASLASNSNSLPIGLFAAPSPVDQGEPGFGAGLVETSEARVTLEAGLLARSAGSRREDDRTLADAAWIGRLFALAEPRMEAAPVEAEVGGTGTPAVDSASQAPPSGPEAAEKRFEAATLCSPIGLGAALGLIACRVHRKLTKSRVALNTPAPLPLFVGPHKRSKVKVR